MSYASDVTILGDGDFAGASSAIGPYTVTEDATSLDITDLSGGVGGVSFSAVEDPSISGSILLRGEPFMLTDPYSGRIKGIVDQISVDQEATMSIDGSTLLLPLVATKTAAPYSGTLGGAINYYASLCGVVSGIQIDTAISTKAVALPGWTADVWTQLKKLAAIHAFEMNAVADVIVIRAIRQRTLDTEHYESIRFNYGRQDAARWVQVYYYNNALASNAMVYPGAVNILDRLIISVDAGETLVTNVPVNMWLQSIDPPQQFTSLGSNDTVLNSSYAVVDKDGKALSPAQWANAGGLMSFAIGADGKSVDITVRGAATQYRAPYRIASSSRDGTFQYSALYIVATGIAFNRMMIEGATGAVGGDAPADDIVVVDEPLVTTLAQANVVLYNALRGQSGNVQTIEVATSKVNRRGDTGQVVYPTFTAFDATIPGQTFTTYDASISGKTFTQWDADQGAITALSFSNQAFGSISGARVNYRNHNYRVRTATSGPGVHTWTAEADTLFSEFDPNWTAKTFTQFDTYWSGKSFGQLSLQPLAH